MTLTLFFDRDKRMSSASGSNSDDYNPDKKKKKLTKVYFCRTSATSKIPSAWPRIG